MFPWRYGAVCLILALQAGVSRAADEGKSSERRSVYSGAPVELTKAPNGAIVNKAIFDNADLTRHSGETTYKLLDGVHIMADTPYVSAFIEGTDGVIVWDTGFGKADGVYYRNEIRKVTQKPIKAVIYSSSHAVLGTSTLIAGETGVKIIGRESLRAAVPAGGAEDAFAEAEPIRSARNAERIEMLLPRQGQDAAYGFAPAIRENGFVPIDTPITQDGQEMTIAGMRVQFFTRGSVGDDVTLLVWLPDKKLALASVLLPMMPSFYAPDGTGFRDPRRWAEAAAAIRDLAPDYLINQYGVPLTGKEKIRRALNDYIDFCNLVMDQTLRGILHGRGPEDLRDFVQLPPHLLQSPWLFESYGLLQWNPPYIMNRALGWWDGDAASLVRPAPKEISERLVPALGGRAKVLALARKAGDEKQYAWALELVNYVYRIDPQDAAARKLKAELLRRSAQASTSMLARSIMLSQALALEEKIRLPRLIAPEASEIAADPAKFVRMYRVRIDPIKAKDADSVVQFTFTDGRKQSVAMHIRHGVVEYVENPAGYYRPADLIIELSGDAWAKLYRNEATLSDLVKARRVKVTGDAGKADAQLAFFDSFDAERNQLVPSAH
ncbi:MAG TPA: alkyl sulfatase dimerization domain-containing protein [Burkholderiales bacterium]|nr:alkyl sulfatase dimerization domain-containing protein [Burkholderiales bacterium]